MTDLKIPGLENLPHIDLGKQPIIGSFIRPLERGLEGVGLTTPSRRLVGIGAATAILLYFWKPGQFFIEGRARPWSLWVQDQDPLRDDAVAIPWWMASVLVGTAGAVFL